MTQAAVATRSTIDPRYFLILLAPISVYFGLEFVLKSFGDGSLTVPSETFAQPEKLIELTGRYKYLAAFAFFGGVSLSILTIFALDLWSNFSRHTVGYSLIALVLVGFVGMVFSVFDPQALWNYETHHLLGKSFFETALGVGTVASCAAGDPACESKGAMVVFERLSNPINALTAFSATAALIGLILSLGRHEQGDGLAATAAGLAEAKQICARYLYCAGILLTAGMTFLIAWMHWPIALIADQGTQAAFQGLVGGLTLFIGVGYSVMILSCYLPVSLLLIQRTRAYDQALTAHPPKDLQTDPDRYQVPVGHYLDALKAVVAILSPVLASAIGTFGQGILF